MVNAFLRKERTNLPSFYLTTFYLRTPRISSFKEISRERINPNCCNTSWMFSYSLVLTYNLKEFILLTIIYIEAIPSRAVVDNDLVNINKSISFPLNYTT